MRLLLDAIYARKEYNPAVNHRSDPKSVTKTKHDFLQIVKRSLLIALFFILPLFLACFGNRVLFLEIADEVRSDAETRLKEALSGIESEKDPIEHFSRLFKRVEKKVFSGPESLVSWKESAGYLKRRYGDQISLVLLDGHGRPVPGFADRQIPRHLSQKFFESYKSFLRDKKPLTPTAQSFVKSVLGNLVPVEREFQGILYFASPPPKNEFVYVSRPYPLGMFLVFFKPNGPLSEMALKEKIERFQRTNQVIRLAYVPRGERSRVVLKKLGLRGRIRKPFWKQLQRSTTGSVWFDDILLSRRILFPSSWVVGTVSLSSLQSSFGSGSGSSVAGFLILAFLVMGVGHVFPFERLIGSVRYKLLFAFLYTALVPLLIMEMTANSFLSERRSVLESETHRAMEKSLTAFDDLYLNHWQNLREGIGLHSFRADYEAKDGYQDFRGKFETYRKRYYFDFCRIFDSSGKEVFEFIGPGFPTAFGGFMKIFPKLARGYFAQLNASRSGPASSKVDPLLAATTISFNPLASQEFRVGPVKMYMLSLPLGNQDNKLTHIAYLIMDRKRMEWNYVRENLKAVSRQSGLGDVFAWSPGSGEMVFPLPFSHGKAIRPFLEKVFSNSISLRKTVSDGDRNLLLTGLRGSRLSHFSFLGVTPDLDIQGAIRDLAWKFRFITLAILGVSVVVGFLLARLIIDPLGNLHRGMEAITARDFRFVIPVVENDELGALARLFNDTLGDLQDLEVARAMQESLFPRKPLRIGSWEVFGSCIPSSQVGGDYFDYFPIDEDRIILILGDVSGHGVGAALVVAMVKAVMGHPASVGKPMDILASLNTILFSILKRKKMMSCCLGIFDRRSGVLTLANAGQTYPVLITEGKPSFLELQGFPLGSVKKWKATTGTFLLEKRELVLLYTDGLIEALDGKDQPIGYERFLAVLPSLIGKNAEETERSMRTWHRGLARVWPPEDDVSLLILMKSREPGGPNG